MSSSLLTNPSSTTINPRRKPLLGHLSFGVKSMPPAEAFYNAVFAALGFHQVYRDVPLSSSSGAQRPAKVCGWGESDADEPFTLFESDKAAPHGARTHLAFNAPSDEAVDAFYAAALANGGRGDGEPGLRKECGEHYYTCFVYDVDGHRLEAVYQWG